MPELLSRDKIPRNKSGNVESYGNFLDYIFYKNQYKKEACETYNERKRRALVKLIDKAVSENLTARQRQIFSLKFYEGLRQVDIATRLKIAPSTVCRALQSSIRKIEPVYSDFLCLKDLFVDD